MRVCDKLEYTARKREREREKERERDREREIAKMERNNTTST